MVAYLFLHQQIKLSSKLSHTMAFKHGGFFKQSKFFSGVKQVGIWSLWFYNGFVITHLISRHSYELFNSVGESMLPTINVNRDYLLISREYKYGRNVRTGDIVSVFKPTDPAQRVCKRITAMAGDIVLVDPSKTSILSNYKKYLNNGDILKMSDEELDEKLLKLINEIEHKQNVGFEKENNANFNKYIQVPEGHCFVTGDNLSASLDSRSYGVVPLGLITGKVIGHLFVENSLNPFSWRYEKTSNTMQ